MRTTMTMKATHLLLERPTDAKVDFGVLIELKIAHPGTHTPMKNVAMNAKGVIAPCATTKR